LRYLPYSQRHESRVPTIISEVDIWYPITETDGRAIRVKAVWDTGATRTFIGVQLADELGIVPLEFEPVLGATGLQDAGVVNVAIKLPNGLRIPDKRVYICALPGLAEMVIGMDIIQLGDLHISNAGGKTLFSFVTPSLPAAFNLEDEANRLNT